MALTTGSVTIHGGGNSTAITLTNDTYGLGLASSFQSISAQFASSGSTLYQYSSGSTFLAVTNGQGSVAVFGPSASSQLLVGDGSSVFYNGKGDATIAAGNGDDTIVSGMGSDTIAAGDGNNVVLLGSGSNEYVESVGNDSIQAGSGSDTVTVDNRATTTIYGGTGNLTLNAVGHVTIEGGNAGVTYAASGASVVLESSSHNNILVANASSSTGVAPGGNVTINGSLASGGNQFWAGSGNASLIGGTGDDTLVGGQGASTLTGGAGANDFDFFTNQGGSNTQVTIKDFGASSSNLINLFGYGASGFSSALASAHTDPSGTTLTLNDGSKIILSGYNGNLSASNVKFN